MLKKQLTIILLLFIGSSLFGQGNRAVVISDIANFWNAYDSLKFIRDTTIQKQILTHQYLEKASPGLIDFINDRHMTASKWITSINKYPLFWKSVRLNTFSVANDTAKITVLLNRFKKIYPEFRQPSVCFFIGNIRTGGTTTDNRVLMGTEIATADSTTNTDGLSPFLKNVFKQNPGVYGLLSHELVHTQQIGRTEESPEKINLLGNCIREGSCDFLAELITEQKRKAPYISYGTVHEKELWAVFKGEMHGANIQKWLYNGSEMADGKADLGYFVGYAICKYYYLHAKDKKKVIREILQVNYHDKASVEAFFIKTGYEPQ